MNIIPYHTTFIQYTVICKHFNLNVCYISKYGINIENEQSWPEDASLWNT